MHFKRLSRVFSNTTVQKHQFFGTQAFFTVQLSHPYMTTGKTIALTRRSYFSRVQLIVTLWTVACQAPLSMGFSRQEYWSGLSCPPSGDLPDPRIEPVSLKSPALAGGFFTTEHLWEAHSVAKRSSVVKSLSLPIAPGGGALGKWW